MAFKFNPFTGNFDYVNKVSGDIFNPYILFFNVSDWQNLGNNLYKLNVVHNRNTIVPEVALYEFGQEVLPEKIEVVNGNILDIYIRYEPFSGVLKII